MKMRKKPLLQRKQRRLQIDDSSKKYFPETSHMGIQVPTLWESKSKVARQPREQRGPNLSCNSF